jgi:hypothetical protein
MRLPRQPHRKGRPRPQFTGHLNGPAVRFDNRFANVQAKPDPAISAAA